MLTVEWFYVTQHFFSQVAGMFADQHDLLRDFCIFIPDCEQPAVFATACTAQLTGLRVG